MATCIFLLSFVYVCVYYLTVLYECMCVCGMRGGSEAHGRVHCRKCKYTYIHCTMRMYVCVMQQASLSPANPPSHRHTHTHRHTYIHITTCERCDAIHVLLYYSSYRTALTANCINNTHSIHIILYMIYYL